MSPLPKSRLSDQQIEALLEENRQLRAGQVLAQAQRDWSGDMAEQMARFRTIFDNSPFGQKIITPDLIIRQANPAVVAMLGCADLADVVGREIMDFAHPDHRADWRYLQQRLWSHKLPSFVLETCLVRTDGTPLWVQVTSIRFPNGDEELGYTLLEDISDRKALELSLKRVYDAQETILHLVTHDLKTPIAHIQLLTDLLERETTAATLATSSAGDTAKFLSLIRQACASATKLLKDVLFLGDLDASYLDKRPTDLPALLQERLVAHAVMADAKDLVLTLDLPAQPLRPLLNASAFERVVDNLVSNALKFTPAGGRVTVALREVNGRARLTVQDTGIGIPEALQPDLFEKFTPSARPGVGGEAATGLGLFITRQIVQQHRGKLWVESQEGTGSCFTVELL